MYEEELEGDSKLTRREFIKLASAGAGSLTLLAGCSAPRGNRRLFLAAEEESLLEAVAEQIIPTDDWPGGREAGVVNFIDLQLAGPYRRFQEVYRTGLAAITETCLKNHGRRFEALSWDQQMSFLRDMESGQLSEGTWKDGFSSRFFGLLRSHSLQGYYGSPRHGGNKNFVSYKMIGLEEVQLVGQNRYRS